MKRAFLITVFALGLVLISSAGTEISVKDAQGRPLEIELIAVSGDKTTFRKKGEAQEFTLPLDRFDGSSQELIRKTSETLGPVIPKIEVDVVIGKRRKKEGESFYRVRQEISTTVKVRNTSNTLPLPPVKGRIVYIGQDRRTPDLHVVMAVRDFDMTLKPGTTDSKELAEFETSYDSDNKGTGNLGGAQYAGYLITFTDEKGSLVYYNTTDATVRRAISTDKEAVKMIADYPAGTELNEKLQRRGAIR